MPYQLKERCRLHARDAYYYFKSRCVRDKEEKIVYCNSYPKSGTHLLAQVLLKVPNISFWNDIVSVQSLSGVMNTKNHLKLKISSAPGGSLVRSHLMYCPEVLDVVKKRNHKMFFMYRDLRDVALSHAKWVRKEPEIFLHDIYKNHLNSDDERLMASICGTPLGSPFGSNVSHPSIGQDFERWRGWLNDPDTLSVNFEQLVGNRGGGSDELRWKTIRAILKHLECEMSDDEMYKLFSYEALNPNKAHTFRKGQIGGWKEAFNEEHKEAFKYIAGDLLIELGYERDHHW